MLLETSAYSGAAPMSFMCSTGSVYSGLCSLCLNHVVQAYADVVLLFDNQSVLQEVGKHNK
jgi:hypothetical protein